MKDLGARWNAVLVLLALSSMFGSQALHATTSPGQITVNPVSISFGACGWERLKHILPH